MSRYDAAYRSALFCVLAIFAGIIISAIGQNHGLPEIVLPVIVWDWWTILKWSGLALAAMGGAILVLIYMAVSDDVISECDRIQRRLKP